MSDFFRYRLRRAVPTLIFLALLGAFFIATKAGYACDPADLDYCIPHTQGEPQK